MRRLAWFAAALAAACGGSADSDAGPLDRINFPTGLAVHEGRLLVASSNADLRFDGLTGGSLMALDVGLDPDAPVTIESAVNIRSFAGDLAIADPSECTGVSVPLALLATRGSNMLDVFRIEDGAGEISFACERCDVAVGGQFADPLPVAVACGGGRSRAFVGYLRDPFTRGWITEYDLAEGATRGTIRNMFVGAGATRAFAYDEDRDRLYVVGLATGTPTPLRWVDLGGCDVGASASSGGCTVGEASIPGFSEGTAVELRSIALGRDVTATRRRAFLTGRRYIAASAATVGGRVEDLGGVLLVVDLVENAFGRVDVVVVNAIDDWGRGAQDVRLLPPRAGRPDVVAALAVDSGELLIYDDETGAYQIIGSDGATGVPDLGRQPFGLAIDPVAVSGVARVYVGSFNQGFVTPVGVPLDTPDASFIQTTASGALRRISGGTP